MPIAVIAIQLHREKMEVQAPLVRFLPPVAAAVAGLRPTEMAATEAQAAEAVALTTAGATAAMEHTAAEEAPEKVETQARPKAPEAMAAHMVAEAAQRVILLRHKVVHMEAMAQPQRLQLKMVSTCKFRHSWMLWI